MVLFCNVPVYWSATGSMIGGIGTWVAAIAAGIVALKISCRQNELAQEQVNIARRQSILSEHEINVALFEKRYAVYKCFVTYYELRVCFKNFNDTTIKSDEFSPKNMLYILIFNNFKNTNRQTKLKKMSDLTCELENSSQKK